MTTSSSESRPTPPAVPAAFLEDYLESYVREEFSRYPDIRVRRSPQDNEPGVLVRSDSREYFFPFEWMKPGRFKEVQDQVLRILDLLT
ncbi:MAG: hypothetical protein H7222_14105 [Methylotenera sp.]|nr:hypothetical protein [Oligoflexia bacterium]